MTYEIILLYWTGPGRFMAENYKLELDHQVMAVDKAGGPCIGHM